VQRLRRLVQRKSVRNADRVFVAEGAKVVEAALASGASVEALYFDSAGALTDNTAAIVDQATSAGIRVFALAPGVMDRVADTVTPQPLIAVVSYLDIDLDQVVDGAVVVLVDVRDPGNVGAIIRSADAAGAAAVVICEGSGDPYNPKTVRASAGSLFHLPLVRGGTFGEVAATLTAMKFQLVGAVAHGGADYASFDFGPRPAIVFGNEAAGLGAETLATLDQLITVPIAGGAESLNVAMAATVISFELARRRRLGTSSPLSMTP